ncbi:MAG: prepilin-type N-terminal cleavage/methylation domain-containing protein [Candidatus Brocadiales bacterium]|nr:prepilin-type N-terminal cleavage/methylation domain-containing protein [Candidatus Brocadiales bacterium]
MRSMRSAYTLTELLVATAVGSIVMAMAFSSFSLINTKYQKYSDLSNLHRSSTQVLNIINRDLRMAGYQDLDTVNGSIAEAVITENDNNSSRGSDAITITYDADTETRIKIRYYLDCKEQSECSEREGRYRLYKTKWSKTNGSWNLDADYEKQAVADYIEDLQFNYNMANGNSKSSIDTNEIKDLRSIDVSIMLRTARKHTKDENYRHELEDNGQFNLDGGYIRETFSTTAFTRNLELGG